MILEAGNTKGKVKAMIDFQSRKDFRPLLPWPVTKRGRGEPVACHEWLARTVRMAKTSGMWEAPQGAERPAG